MDKSLFFSLFYGFVPGDILGLCFTFIYLANNWKVHTLEFSIGTPYHKIVLITTDQAFMCSFDMTLLFHRVIVGNSLLVKKIAQNWASLA